MENEERLRKQLRDQIRFLRNSCRSYDEGHHEEAVRIAVALENLIGPNRNAKSIVSQLGLDSIKLWSSSNHFDNEKYNSHKTVSDNKIQSIKGMLVTYDARMEIRSQDDIKNNLDSIVAYFGLGLMRLGTRARESSYGPDLTAPNDCACLKLITIDEWMQEIVLAAKRKFYVTREELVAVARNKDGGAHVAPLGRGDKLKGAYEALSQNGSLGYFVEGSFVCFFGDDQRRFWQKKLSIRNVHYVALRQMAHEVLNSPDISELYLRQGA